MSESSFLYTARPRYGSIMHPSLFQRWHIDLTLLSCLLALCCVGLFILYSASGQNLNVVLRQATHMSIGFAGLVIIAQIPPRMYHRWAPSLYLLGLVLLVLVLAMGDSSKGAQRWLSLPGFRFQPSEVMKLALPLMVAWYLSRQTSLPTIKNCLVCVIFIAVPVLLIGKQPDLGTSILIGSTGFFVLFFAGLRWLYIFIIGFLGLCALPVLWLFMHDYQKQRVLTFLNPESDPLGTGWNIIQSKIAIGSGGIFGKGWLNGSQAHLEFLPERSTDFIFAVCSEEFGLMGVIVLLFIYLMIIFRGFKISMQAQNHFTRLVSASLTLTFFFYLVINIGMVSGVMPIVGIPLPLISYGGTSIVTLLASFGLLMSIHTHRQLVDH